MTIQWGVVLLGVACANTRRKFIGIEMDTGYYEIAEKRIAEAYTKAQQA